MACYKKRKYAIITNIIQEHLSPFRQYIKSRLPPAMNAEQHGIKSSNDKGISGEIGDTRHT